MRQTEFGEPGREAGSVHEKREALKGGDLEGLAAADVGAGKLVVAAHHIRLRLGEPGTIALVSVARQLRFFAANDPGDLIFPGLPAFGTGQGVGAHLSGLVEKLPFFHDQISRAGVEKGSD